MFTRNNPIISAESTLAYHEGFQPPEYLRLLGDSIRLLDKCVAAARGHKGYSSDKKRDAALNLGLGFGLLAMSESRALLALVSLGLERSARIHFRSLHEYAFRATLVFDAPEVAHDFKIAAARETEKYARWFKVDDARLKSAKERYLADAEPGEVPKKEQEALGGDMASLMRKKTGDDTTYAGTFGYPSLFSHGSILALYEVSESTAGRGADFVAFLLRDGQGSIMLLDGTSKILEISLQLIKNFSIGALDEWDTLHMRLTGISERDGFSKAAGA